MSPLRTLLEQLREQRAAVLGVALGGWLMLTAGWHDRWGIAIGMLVPVFVAYLVPRREER
jgi:hypothetical protein